MEAITYTEATYDELDSARRLVRAEAQIAILTRRLAELEEWLDELSGDVAGAVAGVTA